MIKLAFSFLPHTHTHIHILKVKYKAASLILFCNFFYFCCGHFAIISMSNKFQNCHHNNNIIIKFIKK